MASPRKGDMGSQDTGPSCETERTLAGAQGWGELVPGFFLGGENVPSNRMCRPGCVHL